MPKNELIISLTSKLHIKSVTCWLTEKKSAEVFNLGNGLGYSVKEVIETCEKVTGIKRMSKTSTAAPGIQQD